MTVHTPAHPSGAVTPHPHHYLAWVAIVAAVVLAVGALLLAPVNTFRIGSSMSEEQKSLVTYRAYERADWAASEAYPERQSLIEFRAAEREGR
jgi:hypothetical protein